ncbi:MAG: hypothetical protein ACK4RZ_10040 [Paracoccaceae bacterium]
MSKNPKRGIWLMISVVASLATLDGFSRDLAGESSTLLVVMVLSCSVSGFVLLLALLRPKALQAAVSLNRTGVHAMRGLTLFGAICVIVWGYARPGLTIHRQRLDTLVALGAAIIGTAGLHALTLQRSRTA